MIRIRMLSYAMDAGQQENAIPAQIALISAVFARTVIIDAKNPLQVSDLVTVF